MDIEYANRIMNESGVRDRDVADYIIRFCADIGVNISDADIPGLTYEYILNLVAEELLAKRGIDIVNDLAEHPVRVAANYMATSFDTSGTAGFDEVKSIIEAIPVNEQSETLRWFYEQLS